MIICGLDICRNNVKTGPACLRTCIPNITCFLDDPTKNLKEEGRSFSEITKITWKDIRGICPVCCMWTEVKFLGALLLISHIGRDNVTMRGYGAFLEELLEESNYSQGNVGLAHWIYIFDQQRRVVNLTLISRKDVSKNEKFLVLPVELLSEAERQDCDSMGVSFVE